MFFKTQIQSDIQFLQIQKHEIKWVNVLSSFEI